MLIRRSENTIQRMLGNYPPLQFVVLIGLSSLGAWLAEVFSLPIPGPVVGLSLTLLLLGTGVLKIRSLAIGARLLITELLLFFIPVVLAVVNHPELLGWVGLKVALIVVISTGLVMATTAFTIDFMLRLTHTSNQ